MGELRSYSGDLGFPYFVSLGPRMLPGVIGDCTVGKKKWKRESKQAHSAWSLGVDLGWKWNVQIVLDISYVLMKGFFSFHHALSLMTSNRALRFVHFQFHTYF